MKTMTMMEVYVFRRNDLEELNVKFNVHSMKILQESNAFHNPSVIKLANLQREKKTWDTKKSIIVKNILANRLGFKPRG